MLVATIDAVAAGHRDAATAISAPANRNLLASDGDDRIGIILPKLVEKTVLEKLVLLVSAEIVGDVTEGDRLVGHLNDIELCNAASEPSQHINLAIDDAAELVDVLGNVLGHLVDEAVEELTSVHFEYLQFL
jgi:hypothetical protein